MRDLRKPSRRRQGHIDAETMKQGKPIQLQYTPEYVLKYVKNMRDKEKNGPDASPATVAMLDDICTIIEVAVGFMTPTAAPSKDGIHAGKK